MVVWNLINDENKAHAIAVCSFEHNNPHTLSFKVGDRLQIKEESKDWYLGFLRNKPSKLGIFPKNYVELYEPARLIHPDTSVNEIEGLLREWTTIWYLKYEDCEKNKSPQQLMGSFKNLVNLRNVILANRASIDEIKELKKATADKILKGNHLLHLDVIPYDNAYNRLDATKASTIYLFEELKRNTNLIKQHMKIVQPYGPQDSEQISLRNATSLRTSRSILTYSVKLTLENLKSNTPNVLTYANEDLYVNLLHVKDNEAVYLCENACVDLSNIRENNNRSSHYNPLLINSILFCDLNEKDFKTGDSKLYLVMYAVKNIKTSQDPNFSLSKVFAGGVYDIGTNLSSFMQLSPEKRYIQTSLNLFIQDFDISVVNLKTLNELLTIKDQQEQQRGPKNSAKDTYLTLTFKCELIEATYNKLIDQFTYLKGAVYRKMNFPEIIMPDDYRNDFYITVLNGEFSKAKSYEFIANLVQIQKENDKYVEVGIDLDDDNDLNKLVTLPKRYFFYKSLVYSKQDKPKWNEIIKISIPNGKKVEKIKNTYIRFIIRSRSSNDGTKDKIKYYGKCYIKITNDDGSAIEDKINHQLSIVRIDDNDFLGVEAGSFLHLKATNLPISSQHLSPSTQSQQLLNLLNGTSNMNDKNKEYLLIKVNVVSTQLTQNATLLKLLSFQTEKKPDELSYKLLTEYLDDLYQVKDKQSAEIVKFLQPLFEKLIDILLDLNIKHNANQIEQAVNDKHRNEIQPLVFKILISIFQIIENQNKFSSFRDVIDAYLNKNFSITLAHRPLFRMLIINIRFFYDYFNDQLKKPNNNKHLSETAFDNTINAIKSIEYIFKFAFKSRELLSLYKINHKQPDSVDPFETNVIEIFKVLTQIIQLRNTTTTPTNSTLIHQISTISSSSFMNTSFDLLNGSDHTTFVSCTNSCFYTDMFENSLERDIIKTQLFILKNVINLLPILIQSKRFTLKTIAEFYIGFLDSIFCLKTQFLSKLIRSKLFESAESRHIIIEPLCKALSYYLSTEGNNERDKIDSKIESTGNLFAELMDVLERKDIGDVSVDINELCKFLPQLIQLTIYLKNQPSIRQLYGTIIISMLRIMESKHYQILFDLSNKQKNVEIYRNRMSGHDNNLELLLYMCSTIISDNIFPSDWFDLLLLRDKVVLNALHNISNHILNHHLVNFNDINKQIWQKYFESMVSLLTDPCLQVEKFTETKRKNILQKYGDLRIDGALELKNMWYSLGENKGHFIPEIIDLFLKVALIPIKQINDGIIPLFFDMMSFELYSAPSENNMNSLGLVLKNMFDDLSVPNKLITHLDSHFENGSGDHGFRDSFKIIFTDKFTQSSFFSENLDFVDKVVELIDLLIEYRDFKNDSDISDELNSFYLNELMNFYHNMKRNDLYLKYVDILRQIHVSRNNHICAAHTLTLHAALLNWSNDPIDSAILKYSPYPNIRFNYDLKERIYIDIIEYFTKAKAWEKAFEYSKLLRERYEAQYEYQKLCDILEKQAILCKNILNSQRFDSGYFLVGFYGKQFPMLLKNKQFVFRGEPLENIGGFRSRIDNWFSGALKIQHSLPPTENELNAEAKYIQVIKVDPIYEPKECFQNLEISPKLLKYYQNNEVDKFRHSYRKDTKLNEEDPTLWWLKEKVVTITNKLPNIINFYPVKDEILTDISPVQSAINNVREQYDRLSAYLLDIQEKRLTTDEHMRLISGSIDAGVNGGLPKYQKFLTPEYTDANPEFKDLVLELKQIIYETIDIAETYLFWCLKFNKTHPLFLALEAEQLPKLKTKFSLPSAPDLEKKNLIEQQNCNSQRNILYNYSLSQLSISTEPTPTKKHSASDIMNVTIKSNASRRQVPFISKVTNSSSSQRDSVSSVRSNSDEENKSKYILEETINPKRPLRPKTQTSSTSGSNSTHNSRPVSHVSDDGNNHLSLLPQNTNSSDLTFYKNEHDTSISYETLSLMSTPPPKPPKPANLKLLKPQIDDHDLTTTSTALTFNVVMRKNS